MSSKAGSIRTSPLFPEWDDILFAIRIKIGAALYGWERKMRSELQCRKSTERDILHRMRDLLSSGMCEVRFSKSGVGKILQVVLLLSLDGI